jgi:hypothetical protein
MIKVKIYNLIKVTAGHHHGWYKSNVGIIRKPLGGGELRVAGGDALLIG